MSELKETLSLLRGKMEQEIASSQPYEAMLYCQSFLARKKRSLSANESTFCLVEGAKTLMTSGEFGYAATLIVWFIDSNMLHIDRAEDLLGLLSQVPADQAIKFVEHLYVPLSKFMEANVSTGGQQSLLMLNTFCAPLFEAEQRNREAVKCYHSINDMIGVARVLDAMARLGHPSEYPLFFTRTYLHLLSAGSSHCAILSDAFFVEADNEYMTPFLAVHPEAEACQCWKMCDLIHDLQGLEDKKSSAATVKIDKTGIFSLLLSHYTPLLQRQDPHILNLVEIVGIQVFKVPRQKKGMQSTNPLHAMMSNMFAPK
jgi:hypothetical protein